MQGARRTERPSWAFCHRIEKGYNGEQIGEDVLFVLKLLGKGKTFLSLRQAWINMAQRCTRCREGSITRSSSNWVVVRFCEIGVSITPKNCAF